MLTKCLMAMVCVLVCAAFVRAQGGNARIQQKILATDDRREAALQQGDVATLRQIYADDYTLVSPTGVVQTKADQISDLSAGRLHYNKLELLERKVRIYGDTAVMLTRERADIVRNGEQVGGDVRITRIYKRFGTRWMVIATHASAIRP